MAGLEIEMGKDLMYDDTSSTYRIFKEYGLICNHIDCKVTMCFESYLYESTVKQRLGIDNVSIHNPFVINAIDSAACIDVESEIFGNRMVNNIKTATYLKDIHYVSTTGEIESTVQKVVYSVCVFLCE